VLARHNIASKGKGICVIWPVQKGICSKRIVPCGNLKGPARKQTVYIPQKSKNKRQQDNAFGVDGPQKGKGNIGLKTV
jgi:hypothetical protein